MIVKSEGSYQIKSESGGKNLSKPGLSKTAAVKRLRQVEWFKAHHAKTKVRGLLG